jgi:hypothetical protein
LRIRGEKCCVLHHTIITPMLNNGPCPSLVEGSRPCRMAERICRVHAHIRSGRSASRAWRASMAHLCTVFPLNCNEKYPEKLPSFAAQTLSLSFVLGSVLLAIVIGGAPANRVLFPTIFQKPHLWSLNSVERQAARGTTVTTKAKWGTECKKMFPVTCRKSSIPRRTARDAVAAAPALPETKSQIPAAAGRRRRRGTAGVTAGGSGAGVAGGFQWGRLRPPGPMGNGNQVAEGWRATASGARAIWEGRLICCFRVVIGNVR